MSASNRHTRQQNLAATTNSENETVEEDNVGGGSTITGRNFTLSELLFPATILRFARQGTAWELIRFPSKEAVVAYLAETAGVYRWIKDLNQDSIIGSIADVPTPTLLSLYNRTRGDKPLDRFRDRHAAENRTAEVLMNVAVQWEDTDMAKKNAGAETGQTKTEAKAQEKAEARKAKDAAKAAAKEAKTAETAAKRGDGVIGTIKSFIDSDNGGTQSEMLDTLVTKFPDRTRDGMSSTVKIQCSRLAKSTGREIVSKDIQGRGRVYKFADRGAIPGVEVVKEPVKTDNAPAASAVASAPAEASPASA